MKYLYWRLQRETDGPIRKQKFMHTIGVALIGMGKCPALGRDTPIVRRVMLCEVTKTLRGARGRVRRRHRDRRLARSHRGS
jgi:hypothetical protein